MGICDAVVSSFVSGAQDPSRSGTIGRPRGRRLESEALDEQLKKRLIGAAVLAALAVIFVPMLLESPSEQQPLGEIPPPPPARPFDSKLLREPVPPPAKVAPLVPRVREQPPSPARPSQTAKPSRAEQTTSATAAHTPPKPKAPATEAAPRTGLAAWVVQVGSFSSQENARNLAAKLRKAGLQVLDPERIELRGKVLYRVQVGPVLEKTQAAALLPKVNKIAGTKGKVRAYP